MAIHYCLEHHRLFDADHDLECPECECHTEEDNFSILKPCDGVLCSYSGYAPGDSRRIEVRLNMTYGTDFYLKYIVKIDGETIGHARRKAAAETLALLWLSNHVSEAA